MSEATRVINHRFGEGPHHAPEYRSTNGLLLQSQEEVEAKWLKRRKLHDFGTKRAKPPKRQRDLEVNLPA